MIKIENQGQQIFKKDIDRLEDITFSNLPVEYKDFLIKFNGGCPTPESFDVNSHAEKTFDVHAFFGINLEIESNNLQWIFDEYKNRIPPYLFAIGGTDTSDLICLDLTSYNHGKIVFWDSFDEKDSSYTGNIHDIAENFNTFLNQLYASD